ncbi:hypothetical protein FRC08_010681 [Ceratobasidium sp. 394]|nr:hypothetical protein FRC08_010681 [Ceratobasidium sp. 394]KAG9098993.1 hypothetical protein FS749_002395 [Ceratobasidium sp. UAMH 11750]
MANNVDAIQTQQAFEQGCDAAQASLFPLFQFVAAQADINRRMDARLGEIMGALEGIRGEIQENRRETQEVRRKLDVEAARAHARAVNLNSTKAKTFLVALPREDGVLPPEFPATYDAFKDMKAQQIDALLVAYGLPHDEPLAERHLSLAYFIGVSFV